MRCLIALMALAAVVCLGCTSKPADDPTKSGAGTPAAEKPDAGTPAAPAAAGEEVAAAEVEIGCAMCIFKKEGCNKCTPAVKMGDKVLLLTGYDAGGEHAFCTAAKKATVAGKVEGDKFVATSVTLAP